MKRAILVLGGFVGLAALSGLAATTLSHAARRSAPGRADTLTIRGKLKVIVHDRFDEGESTVIHTIHEEAPGGMPGRVLTLELPEGVDPAPAGSLIEVRGALIGESLRVDGEMTVLKAAPAAGWRGHAGKVEESHATQVREYRMLVMLVNLSDLDQPCTASGVSDTVFGALPESVVSYFQEQSFHQFDLQGQVVGPYTISSSSAHCSASTWQHKADDIAALDPAVIAAGGLASYDTRFYVFPAIPGTSCTGGSGAISGDTANSFGHCGDHVFAHELGHNLGLHHASIVGDAYGDYSDTMGGFTGSGLRHFNAPHKVQMEWIPDGPAPAEDRLLDVTQSGLYTISLLELDVAGTNQVLKLDAPISGPDAYWVSYRTDYGTFGPNISTAYRPKMNVHTGRGLEWYTRFYGSDAGNTTAFADGQTFTDPENDVCITLVSHTSTLAHVWVSFGCVEAAPPACPGVSPCNGISCVRGAETAATDLGLGQCVTDEGVLLSCGSGTVHQVTNACTQAACCTATPFPCICPQNCGSGQYLECR